jgi:uncharacterized protein YbaP (TraB family)
VSAAGATEPQARARRRPAGWAARVALAVFAALATPAAFAAPALLPDVTAAGAAADPAHAEPAFVTARALPAAAVAAPVVPTAGGGSGGTGGTGGTAPSTCPPMVDPRDWGRAVDRGMLWKLTRGGRVSYLFGTVHVGRPAWRLFGPRTAAALASSDTVALELDPTDPAIAAALSLGPMGPPLPEPLAQRLARATERACLPAAALASLHPVLQAITLTVLDARWLGMDPAWSLEMLLAQRAKAARRQVVSLENVELQRAALVPDNPADAQAVVEQNLKQLEDQSSRRVVERLVAVWERGDLETLGRYEAWCECAASEEERAFMRRLNDDRNPHLADRIAALHAQGRRVFAAVGALHMTGEQALPRLLAERGFRVERVAFATAPR